ncbi:MAG: hypothetical protein ABIL12_00065 [candidate division WOR-3 bacterium]
MIPLDPRNIFCFGFCFWVPDSSQFSLNLYSRNNPYAGFVEFTPQISLKIGNFGVLVGMSAFNGRSKLINKEDWNPYREYSLEIVDWKGEPVITKYPLFEALQYRAFGWLDYGFIKVKMGRDYLKVSHSLRYPLLFSGWGYPLDWFYLVEGGYRGLRGYAGFARVPSNFYENKRLAFQRLEWEFWKVKLGITEMVVYTRDDTWKYANPFVLYYVVRGGNRITMTTYFYTLMRPLIWALWNFMGNLWGMTPRSFMGKGRHPLWVLRVGLELMGITGFSTWKVRRFYLSHTPISHIKTHLTLWDYPWRHI